MCCDPASLPVWPAGPVLAAVHRPRDRTVAAKVAHGLLVEGMAMMDDDVHAWARERLADVIYECEDDADAAADAVLAVLPELLTDERVVEAMGLAVFAEVKKYPLPPAGLPDGSIGWGARPVDVGRAAGSAAAEALAGAS